MEYNSINYHEFVTVNLADIGYKIVLITKELMDKRLDDFMKFVNSIRKEHETIYGWKEESKEYFLNPLVDKWKFSFAILNNSDNLCMISINSRYEDRIHLHTVLVKNKYRKSGLSKYMLLKTAETAIDNNINKLELYCQKNNNRALILYLKMGFEIESIRDKNDILLISESEKTRNICFDSLK